MSDAGPGMTRALVTLLAVLAFLPGTLPAQQDSLEASRRRLQEICLEALPAGCVNALRL